MGSGKSTIGKLLAEKMKMNFIDLDEYIEKKTGMTITDTFKIQGEKKFRLIEHNSLKELIEKTNVVISLGGGTPCFHNNMELVNKNGISVYLSTNADILAERLLKVRNSRPLVRDLNEKDISSFIETNLKKRLPFYEKANYTLQSGNKSAEELAEEIENIIRKKKWSN